MIEMFLICALSLPATHHTRPPIVPYQMESDEESKLIAWIRKNNPDAEVFIHEKPQEDLLKNDGYEKVPLLHKGRQIWIKRKPSDKQMMIGTSA